MKSGDDIPAETKAVPVWRLAHPLWLCGFRPFFLATLLAGLGLVALWLLFLGLGWPLPAVPGGAQVWHVHELLFGLSLAAVAGFALTAVPEFTSTPSFRARHVRQLLAWWLAGRVAFWFSGFWPPVLLALAGAAHVPRPPRGPGVTHGAQSLDGEEVRGPRGAPGSPARTPAAPPCQGTHFRNSPGDSPRNSPASSALPVRKAHWCHSGRRASAQQDPPGRVARFQREVAAICDGGH